MANENHLKILEKGVEVWNNWRKEYPDIIPDLSRNDLLGDRREDNPLLSPGECLSDKIDITWEQYDLSGVDFSQANLEGCNLSNINFSGANFSNAKLDNADLRFSCLDKASFSLASITKVDLSQARLQGANFSYVACLYGMCWHTQFYETDLRHTNFFQCSMNNVYFTGAVLSSSTFFSCYLALACFTHADLQYTSFDNCNLAYADLRTAQFSNTQLTRCALTETNCRGADMKGVDLQLSILVAVDFEDANISGSRIYGTSCWDVKTNSSTKMHGLVITKEDDNKITVEDIEVGQFINLLIKNKNIRNVLNSITSKGVLILGRFAD